LLTDPERLSCPLCGARLSLRPQAHGAYLHLWDCPHCHTEVRQPAHVAPQRTENAPLREGCPDCFQSQTHCLNCGDGICAKHTQHFDHYQRHLPRALLESLSLEQRQAPYCGRCFPVLLQRLTQHPRQRSRPTSPWRQPLVWILIFLILVLGFYGQKAL
jgi:hypothetical protein